MFYFPTNLFPLPLSGDLIPGRWCTSWLVMLHMRDVLPEFGQVFLYRGPKENSNGNRD